jgi:hypothetical protein
MMAEAMLASRTVYWLAAPAQPLHQFSGLMILALTALAAALILRLRR